MSKYKIINLFDKLFITCAVFLVVYAWINFFLRDLMTTFVLSLLFSFAIVYLIFFLFNKNQTKKANQKKYLTDIDQYFLAFRLMSKSNQLHLINTIIKIEQNTRILNDGIIYKKDNKTIMILIATAYEKISQFDFINLIQGKEKFDVIKIICNDYDSSINTQILTNTNIEFITKKKLFDEYFFKHSIYPKIDILNTKKSHPKMKEILKNFIAPNKAKSYFLCGLILIFSSIILPYHYYYLIFGSALMILSVLCKLQPLFKH